jgi:XTP/dITP diphosphohydrolase
VKLLVATSNAGKIREISRILKGLPLEIVGLRDCHGIKPAVENGRSFAANAGIKVKSYYRQTRLVTLAEDSGLQVDYLNGKPGVMSARFAGEHATDEENVRELLRLMKGVSPQKRTARFVCVVGITDGRKMWISIGKCEGRIATRPLGTSGFGYDPVFIPDGYRKTFARLGTKTKNEISHRAQALARARLTIERIVAARTK